MPPSPKNKALQIGLTLDIKSNLKLTEVPIIVTVWFVILSVEEEFLRVSIASTLLSNLPFNKLERDLNLFVK